MKLRLILNLDVLDEEGGKELREVAVDTLGIEDFTATELSLPDLVRELVANCLQSNWEFDHVPIEIDSITE